MNWCKDAAIYINIFGGSVVIKITYFALIVYPLAFFALRWLYRRYLKN